MAGSHTTVVGSAVCASPGRYVINHRLPERGSPLPGHCAGFSGLLLKETVSSKEMSHMTQSQSRSKSPASWHPGTPEREGLWIFTRLRDFIDNIANTSPARLALSAFGMVILV